MLAVPAPSAIDRKRGLLTGQIPSFSVSQALKSAVSEPFSVIGNSHLKSHSQDHFQLCPLCLCCRAGPVSESLLSRGTWDPVQWEKGWMKTRSEAGKEEKKERL